MSYIYILKTKKGYYIGSTSDLKRRFKEHLKGYAPSTKNLGKLSLIFFQEYSTLSEARNVERRLKKLKRKDYIEKII